MSEFISLPVIATVASGVLSIVAFAVYTRQQDGGSRLRTIHRLPTTKPFFGDLPQLSKNYERTLDWLSDNCLHFNGEPWRLRIVGQIDNIVLSTPEAFEEVLVKQFDNFPHGDAMNSRSRQLLGDSILTTDGERWFHQRKTAAKFFTSKSLRECMLTTMQKNIGQLQDTLDDAIKNQRPIDMTKLLFQYTLQTFTETGLGVDLRWIGKEEPTPFEDFLEYGSPATKRRYILPDVVWKSQRWLGIGLEGSFLRATKTTRAWFDSLVQQSLEAAIKRQQDQQLASAEGKVKNVVELFLESSTDEKDGLGEKDLTDFLLAFVLAAQDTSALAMMWLLLMLAKHPEVERRIRDEMDAVLPSLGVDRTTYLTSDHVHKLVYLEASIREVLRLYPILPGTRRAILNDTVICGDIPLHKGSFVMLSMYAMARNPNVWGKDAAEFNPSRWINSATGELELQPPTKFATFGAGPRICVGMKLGMLELRVTVANLLHRNRFSLAVPNEGRYTIKVALVMKEPLVMNVERITDDCGARKSRIDHDNRRAQFK